MESLKDTRAKNGIIQVVMFRVKDQNFAVPVWKVSEIIRRCELFPVPGTGDTVEGVINLRGEIIPIVKIDSILEVAAEKTEESGKLKGVETARKENKAGSEMLIIFDVKGGKYGFIVDEVSDVVRLKTDEIRPAPPFSSDNGLSDLVVGILEIGARMVVAIDPEKIFSERVGLEDVVTTGRI